MGPWEGDSHSKGLWHKVGERGQHPQVGVTLMTVRQHLGHVSDGGVSEWTCPGACARTVQLGGHYPATCVCCTGGTVQLCACAVLGVLSSHVRVLYWGGLSSHVCGIPGALTAVLSCSRRASQQRRRFN